MATKKKERMEQEMRMVEVSAVTGTDIPEAEPLAEAPDTPSEENEDSMDLSELLGSMDTEEEEFCEEPGDMEDFPAELLADLDTESSDVELPESMDAQESFPEQETPMEEATVKPQKVGRRKKAEAAEVTENKESDPVAAMEAGEKEVFSDLTSTAEEQSPVGTEQETEDSIDVQTVSTPDPDVSAGPPARRPARTSQPEAPVLTIENKGEVETQAEREDAIWHEIHNAYRTRKILTGQLGGIEQMDNGKTIVIVDYKGFRIIIPLKEMMINLGRNPSGQEYAEFMQRQNKILGNMLGAEIDFIVRGIDSKTRSVVASRREAMLKKRQIFYLDTDIAGMYRIYEGRIVQARVIAVAEKVIRVEVFGVECSIMARDLAWDWIGDAHERFSVGDQVLVRILNVRRDSLEEIGIRADIKSVSQNTNHDNLKKCRIQSKYAGKVTDVYKGVVYIRLSNGVNAVAHSCFDYRTPGKKDDVSFAVTRLDEERGVAVGIITRIIRQNL